ncbi:hypothetical protein [Blastopirellula marina]|uniref:FecR protein domain-containing protein n=1 Tax=Blastopirellula marina TaxID=124 RepID=A0A2S8G1R0_9BACT|nr:hypothetical protein [Blastopirellula marina]PQO38385.1 hypothetical protein C5Y98_09995 [Blastopirellula marina]PTL45042.1 hypothetical protein C5Y97_10005 [Blastopirellula marina]
MTNYYPEESTNPVHVPEHIANLVGKCVSGVASELEWQELNRYLESDDDVLEYYVSYHELHASLGTILPKLPEDLPQDVSQCAEITPAGRPPKSTWKRMIGFASLALTLLGISLAFRYVSLEPGSVARCQFSTASDLQINGQSQFQREIAANETIRFSDGTVGISLDAGIDLVIDGPAELQILNRNRVRLVKGRLLADSKANAEKIYIETANCTVNEHGGRFGLTTFHGRPDHIAVFRGQMNISQGNHSHPLKRGEAVRVESDGKISRLSSVVAGIFPNEADINGTTLSNNVIASVSDNVHDESIYAFYHVAPRGFGEDAPAYADRDHQWNSIGPDGMPEFLQGAEYIMTLNNDIYHEMANRLQIDLKLQKPATVYVLYTECMYVPEWLSKDFVNTGVKIGLDEGPSHSYRPLGVGPNESVDSNFCVWSRRVESPGIVTLGGVDRRTYDFPQPAYGGHNGGNMYGIVVTPLKN